MYPYCDNSLFAETNNHKIFTEKLSHCCLAINLHGHSTNFNIILSAGIELTMNLGQQAVNTTTMGPATITAMGTFPQWFHTYRDWVRSSKGYATRRVYKDTLNVQTLSKHCLWHPRTRIPNYRKVGSYTITSFHILTVLRSTL